MITATYIHTTYNQTPCQGIHGKKCEFLLTERIVAIKNVNHRFKIIEEKCSHNVRGCSHEGSYLLDKIVDIPPTPLAASDTYTLIVDGKEVDVKTAMSEDTYC
jgi:hypothetical protein